MANVVLLLTNFIRPHFRPCSNAFYACFLMLYAYFHLRLQLFDDMNDRLHLCAQLPSILLITIQHHPLPVDARLYI